MKRANEKERELLRAEKIPLWQIGQRLNVSEQTIIRWLRTELPEDKRRKILSAVEEIKAEAAADGE